MLELSRPVSPEGAELASAKLASLRASEEFKAATTLTSTVETTVPHLQAVTSENMPALPQRVRATEEQKTEMHGLRLVDETNAQEMLDKLRGSQDYRDATFVENGSLSEYAGKHIDVAVEVDSDSRASEFGSEHRAGQHIDTEVAPDSDSRAEEVGGKHLAGMEVDPTVPSPLEAQAATLSLRQKIGAAIARRLFRQSK